MNNPYLNFVESYAEYRRSRHFKDPKFPEPTEPPGSAFPLFDKEVQALSTIAREHGIKGGSVKKLDSPVRLQDGWTNFILHIEYRDVDPSKAYEFAPEVGPWDFSFLWEEGFQGVPQNQFQRIALRFGIGFILRHEYPCDRCFGRGHWVSSNTGRTPYGMGMNLFGDPSKICFRCLGYRVGPEFWDNLQARFGEMYDDPDWPFPSAANNEFYEHRSGLGRSGRHKSRRI
jgi:hypothetical protein